MLRNARAGLAAGLAASTVLAGVSAAAHPPQLPVFHRPVLLTSTPGFGGFEPSLVVDRHDNVWATAHRTYTPVSPDGRSTARLRSASWLWTSADGRTFTVPPGTTPLSEQDQYFGVEGDLATDASGNVYFADVAPPKVSFTSWHTTGPGQFTATRSTPSLSVPAYDRPFLASGQNGVVVLGVNDLGASPLAPPDRGDLLSGKSQGLMSFYVSRDGGKTFSTTGFHAPESGICRPHVSRKDPRVIVAVCSARLASGFDDNDGQVALLAFRSTDAGVTWTRTMRRVLGAPQGVGVVFPSIAETSDGALHFLSHQEQSGRRDYTLLLTSSRDLGGNWGASRQVESGPGMWSLTSIAADHRGRLALAGYHRRDFASPWTFKAAVFRPGHGRVDPTPVAPGQVAYPATEDQPPGEFTQAAFDSRGKLRVVYAVRELPSAQPLADVDGKVAGSSAVYYAQQR